VTKFFIPKQTLGPGNKMVDIAAPQFTARGLARLKELRGLRELTVANEKLGNADLKFLGQLAGLRKLTVFAPQVTDGGLAALRDLKALQVLDIRGTDTTSLVGAHLRLLPRLRLVKANLEPNDPKYKSKMAEYRKLLPRVTIQPALGITLGAVGGSEVGFGE
jgi:hypothetical protein